MQLLHAWTSLPLWEFVRSLALPTAVALATFLPGRRVARVAASVVAASLLLFAELGSAWFVRLGWAAIWTVIAIWVGRGGVESAAGREPRRAGFEAWVLGLPLGIGVMLLLLAALSRPVLPPEVSRIALVGVLLVSFGLLHLLTRRHVRRAAIAFAALALGLELLAVAVRAIDVLHEGAPAGAALAAAVLGSALMLRLVDARESRAHAPLVSDAHDLHD